MKRTGKEIIYSGFSTEDTPAIAEATKFNQGIVIVQVNKLVDKVSRVDIPADWVDFVIESPTPYMLNPLLPVIRRKSAMKEY